MDLDSAILNIIGAGFSGTQQELRAELVNAGLEVNQSSVSRALKRLAIVKRQGQWQNANAAPQPASGFSEHFIGIDRNETTIVIKTSPGSANYIASYLDRLNNSAYIGTIAGDDTLIVIPRSINSIRQAMATIRKILTKE